MRYKLAIAGAILLGALTGCSGTPTAVEMTEDQLAAQELMEQAKEREKEKATAKIATAIDQWPDWVVAPPTNGPGGIFAVGQASSTDPTIALQKAKLKAEFELAQAVRQEISGQERQAEMDDGFSAARSEYELLVDRFVAAVPLSGHQLVEQDVRAFDGKATASVLFRISQDELSKLIEKNREAWAGLSSKKAFDQLEERIKASKDGASTSS